VSAPHTPALSADELHDELRRRRVRSAALWETACSAIPSGTVSRARILSPLPFFAAYGGGSRLVDVDGNEYVDCAMGFGFNLLGHAHPVVVNALRDSVADGIGYGTPHQREGELARLLVDAIPCAVKVTFCNSGSEATLNAIRIARAVTGKPGIAKFEGGYHGWYDAVLGSVGFDPAVAARSRGRARRRGAGRRWRDSGAARVPARASACMRTPILGCCRRPTPMTTSTGLSTRTKRRSMSCAKCVCSDATRWCARYQRSPIDL
jgi:glutamate-1-semialdehyde aminotransferase